MNIAIDFETYYSAEYSVATLGNWAYCQHKEFDPYLLSVAWEDGRTWQGNPKDFDWTSIHNHDWIAHNAGFEWAITNRLRELKIIPDSVQPKHIHDSADLAAYLGYPRNLEAACEYLLKVKISKGTRNRAKGKHWDDMSEDFKIEMRKYAMDDAVYELRIWMENNYKWPEDEQYLSRLTRIMCASGVPIDVAAVEEGITKLQDYLIDLRAKVPWAANTETGVLSRNAVKEECKKSGVPPPKSMAKDSEEFEIWLRENGDKAPWAKAIGQYRSSNNLLKKLQTMQRRTNSQGIMSYGLKYGGAHTLRDSGDSGFNVQNLHRAPYVCTPTEGEPFEIDMRGMITAPEGKILAVVDLAAIEPCVLAVLSEDKEFLARLKTGEDPYEAWARITKGYKDPRPLKEVDPVLRKASQIDILGLSYGAGAEKCIKISKQWAGLDISLSEAQCNVTRFRNRPFIPRFWAKIERNMRMSAGQDFELILPSGRSMIYRNVETKTGLSAEIPKLGQMLRCHYWGGSLTENAVQATARDVLMWHALRVQEAGFNIILRVHDELVCLLNDYPLYSSAGSTALELQTLIKIMSTAPPWMPTLPVRASGHLCKKYTK
jgi:hypothetical protein